MTKTDKTLARMRANPRDWRIEQVQAIARARSIEWRQQGTRHIVFVRADGRTLPVPARRPIKAAQARSLAIRALRSRFLSPLPQPA